MRNRGETVKILVVYYSIDYPLRASIRDHLYSFRDHTDCQVYYINAAIWGIPRYLMRIDFDLIIFHTIFLSARWTPAYFAKLVKRVENLKQSRAVKAVLPQDEFYGTVYLNEFIKEFDIDYIFSVAPESEWAKIYSDIDLSRTEVKLVLTGYLNPFTLNRIKKMEEKNQKGRSIDIGYRAWRAEPWSGRHGYIKYTLAEIFKENSPRYGINTDISTELKDTFFGDDWYRFLLSCKYTVGVEGGTSILDSDGSIRNNTLVYLKEHPEAGFEEVEAACFPGLDGSLSLFAVSPRHLEACATKTCQILVEGQYSGVLEKGKHYIELKKDFSNMDEVLRLVQEDEVRKEITERAYLDVVESGEYNYDHFVRYILNTTIGEKLELIGHSEHGALYKWTKIKDHLAWVIAAITGWGKRHFPEKLVACIKNVVAGVN